MQGVRIRNHAGTIRTSGVADEHKTASTTVGVLNDLQPFLSDYAHPVSGTKFGGALLGTHLSTADINNTYRPILQKAQQQAGISPQDAKTILDHQEEILKNKPGVRAQIQKDSLFGMDKVLDTVEDPFKEMTNRQLFHHVLTLSDQQWMKTKEIAGRLAGKNAHPHMDHQDMPQIIQHTQDRYTTHKGGSFVPYRPGVTGGSLGAHFMDISMSERPLHAAKRIEFSRDGGTFSHAMKAALYGAAVAPTLIKNE